MYHFFMAVVPLRISSEQGKTCKLSCSACTAEACYVLCRAGLQGSTLSFMAALIDTVVYTAVPIIVNSYCSATTAATQYNYAVAQHVAQTRLLILFGTYLLE
jgi:hypothetical protein